MKKVICVYSSSSDKIDTPYFELAARLGRAIAANGDTLLFGGGMRGLMGATATAAHDSGAKVIGIIPEALNLKGIAFEACDEMVVTRDIRERKSIMDERSEAFIALPGGFGTLEELIEIISLKLLKYHNKPVVILNCRGFYDAMLKQFDDIIGGSFAKPESRLLYHVTSDVAEAIEYINAYKPIELTDKWLT
ncbi:MAG TPA: TIGR00730 family Rossman fold protein [Clostridia bacterium]|nr:TIGR00730 family Rossman fold protein [Clostridia bacterium]